VSDFLEGWESG